MKIPGLRAAAIAAAMALGLAAGAEAHRNTVSPKDGCHKQDGELHFHKEGTQGEVAGTCVRDRENGVTAYFAIDRELCAAERSTLQAELRTAAFFANREAAAMALLACLDGPREVGRTRWRS